MSDFVLTIIMLTGAFLCVILSIAVFICYKKTQHDAYISFISGKLSSKTHNISLSNHVFRNPRNPAVLHRRVSKKYNGRSQEDSPLEIQIYGTKFIKSRQITPSVLNAFNNSGKENTPNGSSATGPQKEHNITDKVH